MRPMNTKKDSKGICKHAKAISIDLEKGERYCYEHKGNGTIGSECAGR